MFLQNLVLQETNVQNVMHSIGDTLKKLTCVEIQIVLVHINLLEEVLVLEEKVKKFHILTLGKDLKNLLAQQEFLVKLLKDIQL